MRRENGRHSVVTGAKLRGNMTIKNVTADRGAAARSGKSKDRLEQKAPAAHNWVCEILPRMTDNPSFAHSLLNGLSASSNTDLQFQNRKIRPRMVQHKHRVDRQSLKSQACADDDFIV